MYRITIEALVPPTAQKNYTDAVSLYSQRFEKLTITDVVIFLNEMAERKNHETPLGKPFSPADDKTISFDPPITPAFLAKNTP